MHFNNNDTGDEVDHTQIYNWFDYNIFTPGNEIYYRKQDTLSTVTIGTTSPHWLTGSGGLNNTFPSEWGSNNISGDPSFTNPSAGDFSISSGSSPAVDAARWLTEVNDSGGGSGTDMVVDDATFFYDGWGIVGETGDTIYVDNPSSADFEAVISSISGNTITLTASKTWDDNADVYWCPAGVCYSGSTPEIGAKEYTPTSGTEGKINVNTSGTGKINVNTSGTGKMSRP
jgi:hypothetical protein